MRIEFLYPEEEVLFAITLGNYPLLLDHGVLNVASWRRENAAYAVARPGWVR